MDLQKVCLIYICTPANYVGEFVADFIQRYNEDQRGSRMYSQYEHLFVKKGKLVNRTWIVLFEKS